MNPRRHGRAADPGLQPERTTLAWNRTLVSFVVVAAFFLRWGPEHGAVVVVLFGAALAVALGIWLTQRPRYAQRTETIARNLHRASVGAPLLLGAAVVLLGTAALVVVIAL
ncbi:DUF202 domain-containing protein [Kocuria coralli]|uniref:DUF202 domain-containing protein n=1 Tax=Kocuria coralli TaxID=1461025 RepID=A0A5J5KX12_9MICC|nr:DUF202 domain-containing protein [Kocuria coralli]KAA9394307.1 DUF202 domain-containing protein [Kocuria coralli]